MSPLSNKHLAAVLAKFRVDKAVLEADMHKINQALQSVDMNIQRLRSYLQLQQNNVYTKSVVSSFMVKNAEVFVDKIITTIVVAQTERHNLGIVKERLALQYKQLLKKIAGLDDLAIQQHNKSNTLMENMENQELIDMINSYAKNLDGFS